VWPCSCQCFVYAVVSILCPSAVCLQLSVLHVPVAASTLCNCQFFMSLWLPVLHPGVDRFLFFDERYVNCVCRSACPIHGMMILNKQALENWVEPITDQLEFQIQTPFLLYRSGKSRYTPSFSTTMAKVDTPPPSLPQWQK